MHEGFDPYYKWLAIPPQERPPNHYRLLAIPLFEADPEVIESAADQRMGHVRTFQAGRYGALSQQILNELAAARVCLLSREKKLAYDAELQAMLAPAPPLPPPPQTSVPTVLRSPPPPAGLAPAVPPMPSQGEIAAPPAGSVLSRPAPVFPPLDSTLPDPTSPVVRTSRKTASESGRFSLVVSVLGAALLACAAAGFWVLYAGHGLRDPAGSGGAPSASAPQPIPESVSTLLVEDKVPIEQEPNVPAGTVDSLAQAEPISSDDPIAQDLPTPERAEPSDPVEASVVGSMAGLGEEATEPKAPMTPSLADLLKEAAPAAPSSDSTDGTTTSQSTDARAEDLTQEKDADKWRVPRSAAQNRTAARLQSLTVPSSFSTLLVEAQKSDRRETEVYVLLTAAHNKALMDLSADGVLQTLDLIEDKFYEDCDEQRIKSLLTIGRALVQQKNSRQLRALAAQALQASQKAQQEGNKPLAKSLGNVALEIAGQGRDTAQQERIRAYLEQL